MTNTNETPSFTPEMLERFRQSGIRLDRCGRFWHEGAEITHEGMRRALLRWMDRLDDGRPILRLDALRYAYLDVDDAHLLVLAARHRDDRIWLALNDGAEEELDYTSVSIQASDNAMYCRVRGGRLEARITTQAYYVIAQAVEETSDGFSLRACGRSFPVGQRQS